MSFIRKRNRIYHLQVKVPSELTDTLGSGDISISLGTGNKRKAGKLAELANVRYQLAFRELRAANKKDLKSMVNIKKLVRDYVKDDLADFELAQSLGKVGDSDTVDVELEALDVDLSHSREALSMRRHVSFMEPHLSPGMLQELATVTDPREQAMDKAQLCYDMLRARIRLVEANIEQLTGHFSGHDVETILKDLGLQQQLQPLANQQPALDVNPSPAAGLPAVPMPVTDSPAGPTLSELVDEFQRMKVDAGKWRETTVMNHKPKLEALMQVLGRETLVNQITVDQCREFARILEGLPPSFSLKGYKDLGVLSSSEMAGKHTKTLDTKTKREYLNLARSLFDYALQNEYIEKQVMIPGLIPPKKGNTRSLRSAYTAEDLKVIFNPKTFNKWAGDSPARFWVPKLALWTGGRLEELSNLNACDVMVVDTETEGQLICIDHNLDGGRTLKNQNAVRTIPLHPSIAKEFKAYADSVPPTGRLFPELSKANGRYSHALSKAFMRYLRVTCKITDPKKNFHSLRHTVTDHLWKAQVMESIIEELLGRAGKSETSRRYAKGYRTETLYREAVLKLDFKLA